MTLAHLPTLMLVIGYACFWLELYALKAPQGVTSPLAWIIFAVAAVVMFFNKRSAVGAVVHKIRKEFLSLGPGQRFGVVIGCVLGLTLLVVALRAALLPPHLLQESDALNYHYPLTRQHLIRGSFDFIPWASADLFLLPVQFSLAPFWFVTTLPNKIPQFLFLLGTLAIVGKLACRGGADGRNVFWAIIAVLAMHNIGIQAGTAMLDLVICYLFLAALDSLLAGKWLWLGVEFALFFWSKPFVPLQVIAIALLLAVGALLASKKGWPIILFTGAGGDWRDIIGSRNFWRKIFAAFFLASVFIAGPFIAKSCLVNATPLYPFASGILHVPVVVSPETTAALAEAAEAHMGAKELYGYGRGIMEFARHFWLVAVPDKGVNNKFDYPLGLPYLLLLLPFFWYFAEGIRARRFEIIPVLIIVYWLLWWVAGSQQSRFLYIPVMLMLLFVLARLRVGGILGAALILALLLNLFSVYRAHKGDLLKAPEETLRKNDLQITQLSREYLQAGRQDEVVLVENSSTFAQFPVRVTSKKLPFILGGVE